MPLIVLDLLVFSVRISKELCVFFFEKLFLDLLIKFARDGYYYVLLIVD
jgi:hypothetical protein